MKTFNELKNMLIESSDKRYKGIKYEVKKLGNKYQSIVDGEVIDTYPTETSADKAAREFIELAK